jgi:hypothetical protein
MSFYHIAFAFLFDQNKLECKKYLIRLEEVSVLIFYRFLLHNISSRTMILLKIYR